LGAKEGVAQTLTNQLSIQFPNIQIVGLYSPPFATHFSADENNKMVQLINAAKPDIVFVKPGGSSTTPVFTYNGLGDNKYLAGNSTSNSQTDSSYFTTLNTSGFSVGSNVYADSTNPAVSVQWKKDKNAGIDVVTYTGTGINTFIPHSLGVIPEMIIVKSTSSVLNWAVYHKNFIDSSYSSVFPIGGAQFTDSTYWNSTTPTSEVFSLGTSTTTNTSGASYVAFLFASVKGFSKVGSFVGNSSADGAYVECGFCPKLVLLKAADSATASWYIIELSSTTATTVATMGNVYFNGHGAVVPVNSGTGSFFGTYMQRTANGFKLQTSSTTYNSTNMVYAAWAEVPTKYGLTMGLGVP
jgi:hypothetical protein